MKPISALVALVLMGGVACLWPAPAAPQEILPGEQAEQMIAVTNIRVEEGTVSGDIVNRCSRTLRNVQLLIRHTWHWKNEFRPGEDEQGKAVYHAVGGEIAPGTALPFVYRPEQSLPSRPDGYFVTTVTVAGFSEMVR